MKLSYGKKVQLGLLVTIAPLIVLLDQWTKIAVLGQFGLGESVPIIQDYFNLTYVRNTGAAFGIFAQSHPSFRIPFFLTVPIIALIMIGWIFKKIPDTDRKLALALSLVIGGAIGNLIDRVRLGYVVDFLDFHWKGQAHFPAFNVADSAICVGVGILMLDLVFPAKENKDLEKGSHVSDSV